MMMDRKGRRPQADDDGSGDDHTSAPDDRALLPDGEDLPEATQRDVWALAELARSKGLRFWDTEFEVITRRRMVELGTYVLPYRWAHWTFGREYARMQKLHDLGLVEILELVINTRPARAYLLDANSRDDNRMVIAHVFAHVDFFANNMWFERTPSNILREAHHHERRLRELQELYGRDAVERVLDRALSIQWYVDFYRHYERATPRADIGGPDTATSTDQTEEHTEAPRAGPPGVTPSDLPRSERRGPTPHVPPPIDPQGHRDLLEFLITHGPMSELEREVLEAVRDETLYFYPNALTKIMNEGWATYWHAELLREFLPFGAFDEFAVKHSHLMQSEGLNPYKLGFLIYEDIRRRGDAELGPGAGLRRIFEVRRYGDDVSFIRDHLTQEVVDAAGLYLYDEDPETGERTVSSTRLEDVRPQILGQLENMGRPYITVQTGDHEGRGELLLKHHFDGRELDMDRAGDVLTQIHGFWKSPVHIDSVVGGKPVRLTFDGEKTRVGEHAGPDADKQAADRDRSRGITPADRGETEEDDRSDKENHQVDGTSDDGIDSNDATDTEDGDTGDPPNSGARAAHDPTERDTPGGPQRDSRSGTGDEDAEGDAPPHIDEGPRLDPPGPPPPIERQPEAPFDTEGPDEVEPDEDDSADARTRRGGVMALGPGQTRLPSGARGDEDERDAEDPPAS